MLDIQVHVHTLSRLSFDKSSHEIKTIPVRLKINKIVTSS
jgi:hypothetical protein